METITLAVTPGQAEVLAYAHLSGTFHITLRPPVDDRKLEPSSYSANNFEAYKGR